ncbi:unnamed protein product, partial [Prorocentrum cordatum]
MVECILIWAGGGRHVAGWHHHPPPAFARTAQLLCGRSFGRTFVCPTISPKKTLEGYAGGALVTCAYGAAVHGWRAQDALLAFTAGCAGDMYFSTVKRRLGIK